MYVMNLRITIVLGTGPETKHEQLGVSIFGNIEKAPLSPMLNGYIQRDSGGH